VLVAGALRYDFKDGLICTDYAGPGDPETIRPASSSGPSANGRASCAPAWRAWPSTGRRPGLKEPDALGFADRERVVAVYVNPGPGKCGSSRISATGGARAAAPAFSAPARRPART